MNNERLNTILNEMRLSFVGSCNGVNELHGLYELIQSLKLSSFNMVEVGSFEGKSTELFALFFEKVYSIDPYLPYTEISHSAMEAAENKFIEMSKNYSNIEKIKKMSLDAVADFQDETLSFVYIDGAHYYESVKADIIAWLPKVKKGGYISGHDFWSVDLVEGAVSTAVREIFPNDEILTFKDSSWLVRKS